MDEKTKQEFLKSALERATLVAAVIQEAAEKEVTDVDELDKIIRANLKKALGEDED